MSTEILARDQMPTGPHATRGMQVACAAASLLLIAAVAIDIAPGTPAAFAETFEFLILEPLALGLSILLFLAAAFHAAGPVRTFWILLASASGAWLAGVHLPASISNTSFTTEFLGTNIGFLFSYSLFLIAAELRLDEQHDQVDRLRSRIAAIGGVLLILGLQGYFWILPSLQFTPESQSPFVLHLLVDLYLTVLYGQCAMRARTPGWRRVYGLITIAMLFVGVADGLSAAMTVGLLEYRPGHPINALWFAWYLPFFYAPAVALRINIRRWPKQEQLGKWNPLIIYGFVFPILHLAGYGGGWFSTAVRQSRDWFTVVWLLGLLVLLYVQHVLVRRQLANLEMERAAKADQNRQLQMRLQQRQRMELVGQLTGGLAHDFGNMVTAIDAFADLLTQSPTESRRRAHLRDLRSAVDVARDLIGKMQVVGGRAESTTGVVDASLVMTDAVQILHSSLPPGIELVLMDQAEKARIMVSPGDVHQLVMNLIINARDAVGERGWIQVILERVQARGESCASCGTLIVGEFLAIRVADSGGGISVDLRDRIFEPLITTKAAAASGGLGLAIVHGISHQLGGHVTLDDAAAGGAEFSVFLPLAQRQQDNESTETESARTGEPGRA